MTCFFFDFLKILIGSERKCRKELRHIRAKFRTNRSSDGLEIVAGEKEKKKSKATEKYNITTG